MKIKLKLGLMVCMLLSSGYMATRALGTITPHKSVPEPDAAVYADFAANADDAEYVLRDYGGCIGVFRPDNESVPVQVTAIELSCLRELDRAMIEKGLLVSDREQLLTLLEDLGS